MLTTHGISDGMGQMNMSINEANSQSTDLVNVGTMGNTYDNRGKITSKPTSNVASNVASKMGMSNMGNTNATRR
jgi:hypothetical protein